MPELLAALVTLAVLVALFSVAGSLMKMFFAVLLFPLKAAFWLLGAVFSLILLPFQILGGLLTLLLLLPVLAVALPLLLGLGVPILLVGLAVLPIVLVVGLVSLLFGAMFGLC